METKIYSYGALIGKCPPALDKLLRQQTRYYNTLIELENLRRAMFTGLEEDLSPEVARASAALAEAESSVSAALDAISEHRKSTRARAVPVELRSARDAAIERKKVVVVALRQAKAAHRSQFDAPNDEFLRRKTAATSDVSLADLKDLSGDKLREFVTHVRDKAGAIGPRTAERLNSEILDAMLDEPEWSQHWKAVQILERTILAHEKEARRVSGLPHGTYSLADDAIDAAKRTQKVDDLQRKWIPFDDDLPVEDSGRVGIQLTGGLSVPDLLTGNSTRLKLRVESAEERELAGFDNRSARWRRRNTRAVATIAIDSGDGGWEYLDIPISYHRQLPPNATVKWAWLLVRRDGLRLRYDLQLTITIPDEIDIGSERRAEICAINPGWRHFEDGSIRVAYVVGSDGHWEDLRLPATQGTRRSVADRLAFADSLHSASDKLFNEARDVFSQMLPQLTESVRAQCKFISQWRDHRKLHRMIRLVIGEEFDQYREEFCEWVNERRAEKRDLMPQLDEGKPQLWYLYCWTRKDDHLYQMALDISHKAARDRDQQFAIWAKRLSERYQQVLLSDDGLKKLAEKTDETASVQLRAKSRAASGTFIAKVREKFSKQNVVKDKGVNATRTCAKCGHVHEGEDLSRDSVFTCARCEHEQDQDETNCRNRLAWYSEKRGDTKIA